VKSILQQINRGAERALNVVAPGRYWQLGRLLDKGFERDGLRGITARLYKHTGCVEQQDLMITLRVRNKLNSDILVTPCIKTLLYVQ
jgi:hypothetical protein